MLEGDGQKYIPGEPAARYRRYPCRYPAGGLPVFPHGHYQLNAWLRDRAHQTEKVSEGEQVGSERPLPSTQERRTVLDDLNAG